MKTENFNLILKQVSNLPEQWVTDFSKPFLPEIRDNMRYDRRVCRVKQLLRKMPGKIRQEKIRQL